MTTPQPARARLTVVMPAYNEEDAIDDAVAEVRTHILDRIEGAELVVVNDGSRDRTGERLDAIARTDGRVRVLHQANGGHGAAVMTGLNAATGEYVFLLDSDRQIPLDDFADAWHLVEGGRTAVFGVRRRRHDPALRLMLTAVVRRSLRLLFRLRIHDANVPYKLFPRRLWIDASPLIPPGTLAPSLFLAAFMKQRDVDIVEVDVVHRERNTGEVSIRRWRLLKFCARGFSQLIAFRRRLQESS